MALAITDEDVAAAHSRQQPQWAADLLTLAKKDFGKQPSDAIQKLLTKKSDTFMMEVPLFVMDFGKMAIPQVWPLLGAVQKAKEHWYGGNRFDQCYAFPPPGIPLNVACYKSPLDASQVGHVERENCDILFLSWLLRYKEVKELQMETAVAQFQKAATSVPMHFSLRVSEADKVAHAYQLKEDEEKAADIQGHSLLSRARELNSIQAWPCIFALLVNLWGVCLSLASVKSWASAGDADPDKVRRLSCNRFDGLHGPLPHHVGQR